MELEQNRYDKDTRVLRRRAEDRLRTGSAPTSGGPLDGEALALLYTMASDPTRSSDALRLLQELQVYQVELDLQRAQLESNEREMSRELARYRRLFAITPAACLVVCAEGYIVDANPAAAGLLGAGQDDLAGRRLIDFLKPESHLRWTASLRALTVGEQPVADCEVLAGRDGDDAATARLSVSVSSGDDEFLLLVAIPEPVTHVLDSSRQSR